MTLFQHGMRTTKARLELRASEEFSNRHAADQALLLDLVTRFASYPASNELAAFGTALGLLGQLGLGSRTKDHNELRK
jgi:hypothetical protein